MPYLTKRTSVLVSSPACASVFDDAADVCDGDDSVFDARASGDDARVCDGNDGFPTCNLLS